MLKTRILTAKCHHLLYHVLEFLHKCAPVDAGTRRVKYGSMVRACANPSWLVITVPTTMISSIPAYRATIPTTTATSQQPPVLRAHQEPFLRQPLPHTVPSALLARTAPTLTPFSAFLVIRVFIKARGQILPWGWMEPCSVLHQKMMILTVTTMGTYHTCPVMMMYSRMTPIGLLPMFHHTALYPLPKLLLQLK